MTTERQSTAAAAVRPRLRWIDGAKGIGIILVVYGHAARALFPGPTGPVWQRTADRLIYAFHMPLFFVIAGLFVWRSLARGRVPFVTDKLVTIVYPYFLWSLIEGGLEYAFAPEVNTPITLRDLAMTPVLPIEQFWFLYVLAACLVLALLCYPYRVAIALVAIAGIPIAAIYGAGGIAPRTLAFFPYVAAGILFSGPIVAIGSRPYRTAVVLIAAVALFVAGVTIGPGGPIASLAIALAGSVAVLAVAALIDPTVIGGALALLGRASLAIYVMHTICSAGLRIALRVGGVTIAAPWEIAATTLIGLAAPLAVWWLAERYGLSTLLGFGREGRRRTPQRGLFDRAAV